MSTVPERRENLPLRELIAKAYLIIEPFFDPANAWNGQTLELLAYRVVREQLPDIPAADAQVIVSAATRIYRGKHPCRNGRGSARPFGRAPFPASALHAAPS